jgi:hypothetical protein
MNYPQKMARVLDAMGGLYLVDDLLTAIHAGQMQSFVVNNSWMITAVQDYPRARKLQVIALAGDISDRDQLEEQLLGYASSVNASLVGAHGRLGWAPHARELGWRLKAKSYLYQRDM